jgi:hypothetical protein
VEPGNWVKAGVEWFEPEAYRQFETETETGTG